MKKNDIYNSYSLLQTMTDYVLDNESQPSFIYTMTNEEYAKYLSSVQYDDNLVDGELVEKTI